MRLALILLSFLCWGLTASATAPAPVQFDLLPAAVHNPDNPEEFIVGLDLQLQQGWKTYWRAPGIAGEAMQIDSSGSDNLAALDILWPFPKRFLVQGIYTNGYEGDVVVPLRIKAKDIRKPVSLRLLIDLIVCKDLCIPVQKEITQTVRLASTLYEDETLSVAIVMLPKAGAALAEIKRTGIEENGKSVSIFVEGRWIDKVQAPDIFVDTGAPLDLHVPEWTMQGDEFTVRIPVKNISADTKTLLSKDWRIVIGNASRSADYVVHPQLSAGSAVPFAFFLLLAFAGGILLNVMPCVLPVLALKFLAMARHAGQEHKDVRKGFLLTACGIMASFFVLALLVVALKMLGHSVGWGIQFQQPVFLIVMIALLLVFAANLSGLFELGFLQKAIMSLPFAFPKSLKNFGDGVFAAVLATPCTAPLLGTAAGFALAGSAEIIFAVFLTIGLGFAFPYLCVALFPHAVVLLPRPGKWMVIVKRILALCLVGTALWLGMIFVSGTQSGTTAWQPFSEQELTREVQSGRVVLVDITADWCLTCKVNEIAVLDREKTQQFLTSHNVLLMRADWTRKDDAIAGYLRRMKRAGIPFNAVYGPETKEGTVLNEILTFNQLKEAVERAGDSNDNSGGR